jgi:hypothetical protein
MKKVRKISISRSGLKTDKLDIDTETMALLIPSNKKDAEVFKNAYVERMKTNGIILNFQKDIHYKKPFWKFWGMKDYSIAVYNVQFS